MGDWVLTIVMLGAEGLGPEEWRPILNCLDILHIQTFHQRMDDLIWSTMLLKHYFHSLRRPMELANDALMKSFHSQQQSLSCVFTQ